MPDITFCQIELYKANDSAELFFRLIVIVDDAGLGDTMNVAASLNSFIETVPAQSPVI